MNRNRVNLAWRLACLLTLGAVNAQAATITVNSLGDTAIDDGLCTFREAIIAANSDGSSGALPGECSAGGGNDLIEFSVAGTIQPTGVLPVITTVVHVNGYSAPGASVNTLPLEQGTNAVLTIELDGALAGNFPGLALQGNGASGSIVEGLVINNSANSQCCNTTGIYVNGLNGAAPTWIRGNFIGTNSAGTTALPKGARGIWATGAGIVIGNASAGPLNPAYTNLISGGVSDGVLVNGGTGAVVRGNLIGTNYAGTSAVRNGNGINLSKTNQAEVTDNVVSGQAQIGIYVTTGITDAIIARNRVGTNASGANALPNLRGGIVVYENSNEVSSITQDVDIVENLVAYNACPSCSGGIVVALSNSAHTTDAVRVQRNRVFSNSGLEIDLAETNATDNGVEYGVTENDPDDPDNGPNRLQNFPVLTLIDTVSNEVSIQVDLDSEAARDYTIDFYQTSACDGSGHGGAEAWLFSGEVTTDANGDASGQFQMAPVMAGGFATATATHAEHGTSEFSLCLPLPVLPIFEDGFEAQLVP